MEDATLVQPASSHLVLRSMSDNGEFPLEGEMLVGREIECDISLYSGHISRYHSKISVSPNGIFIEDLKSTNGTYVNGKRITGRTRIGMGDEIAFHEIRFRIVSDESGDAEATLLGDAIPPGPRPEPESTNPHVRHPAPTVSPEKRQLKPEPVPASAKPAPVEDEPGESTQLLSATHLHRLVDRSQHAQKDINVGSGARLIMLTAPLRGKVFSLDDAPMGKVWQVGRDNTSDICINDKTLSAHHAKISKVPNGYLLTALEAKNGVIVNGRSQDRVFLNHDDKIQMGRIELTFRDDKAGNLVRDDEDELINQQLKKTRLMVMGALLTLTVLVTAVILNLLQ
ncbi:MAG: FHA domain-containing protein [Ketobacteraceae bacterium]|nr:FHA domain-containing protein [Ketobacteraceae bacterium]